MSAPLIGGGGYSGDVLFGITREQVASDTLPFPLGVAGLRGTLIPAQVEFALAAAGFVSDLIEVVGGFRTLRRPYGLKGAIRFWLCVR